MYLLPYPNHHPFEGSVQLPRDVALQTHPEAEDPEGTAKLTLSDFYLFGFSLFLTIPCYCSVSRKKETRPNANVFNHTSISRQTVFIT